MDKDEKIRQLEAENAELARLLAETDQRATKAEKAADTGAWSKEARGR